MAELILTDKEREAATYLEWDEAAIGRGVKKIATTIADKKGENAIISQAAVILLCEQAVRSNADSLVLNLTGVTCSSGSIGDWKVSIERVAR